MPLVAPLPCSCQFNTSTYALVSSCLGVYARIRMPTLNQRLTATPLRPEQNRIVYEMYTFDPLLIPASRSIMYNQFIERQPTSTC